MLSCLLLLGGSEALTFGLRFTTLSPPSGSLQRVPRRDQLSFLGLRLLTQQHTPMPQ
ncbi:hypothetical protein TorRG33x02_063720 [Trema orientale]|uniref:Uncharacterized protein n=1 Tax=Trema orientale TaxID=63057 RepID=A0A2P5FJ24_TREOI|nr:hypothetical protein TorRG33x02_063720 [Trema orientale]